MVARITPDSIRFVAQSHFKIIVFPPPLVALSRGKLGRRRPNVGGVRGHFGRFRFVCLSKVDFGQRVADLGPMLANFGPELAKLGQALADYGPMLIDICRIRPNVGPKLVVPGPKWPMLIASAFTLGEYGSNWETFGRFGPDFWPSSSRTRATSTKCVPI